MNASALLLALALPFAMGACSSSKSPWGKQSGGFKMSKPSRDNGWASRYANAKKTKDDKKTSSPESPQHKDVEPPPEPELPRIDGQDIVIPADY